MNDDWMNHPKLKQMSQKKLNVIKNLITQARQKKPDEILPFFMAVNARAAKLGIRFNDDETGIILDALKENMSPEDLGKVEMIRNFAKMMGNSGSQTIK